MSTMDNVDGVTNRLQDSKSFSLWIAGASFVFFTLMGLYISPMLSLRYLKPYSRFSDAKKADWDTRIGSNVHAVISSVIALYCLFFDEVTNTNPVWSQAVLVRCGISLTFGYISADFLLILKSYRLVGDIFTLTHHLMAIFAYYFVMVYGVLLYFGNFRQLAELSTVFVNQRWYFSAAKEPYSSRRFLFNAWSMAVSFFLCRIAVMPYYYLKCYQVWYTPERQSLGLAVTLIWMGASVVLDIINVYWMAKMVKGGWKVLMGKTKTKET